MLYIAGGLVNSAVRLARLQMKAKFRYQANQVLSGAHLRPTKCWTGRRRTSSPSSLVRVRVRRVQLPAKPTPVKRKATEPVIGLSCSLWLIASHAMTSAILLLSLWTHRL